MNPIRYVAFLRGINVGGANIVKMAELKTVFETLDLTDVKTILNSGNVLFSSKETSKEKLTKELEKTFERVFGRHIPVMIRSIDDIKKLIDLRPYQDIRITPNTRLYITFCSEKLASTLKIPYESPEKDFTILAVHKTEICSVLTLSSSRGTTEAMNILEKEYGKNVTTRNWNTVLKLVSAI